MKGTTNIFADLLANFGWWLYVKVYWRHNKTIQEELTADVRDNLGYYLREGHSRFK